MVAFQKFLTEQNNLRAIQVIANQTVVQAEAQARANIAKANGESQAIRIINEQLRQNPQYLQWKGINRWNGQLPLFSWPRWSSTFLSVAWANSTTGAKPYGPIILRNYGCWVVVTTIGD